MSALVEMSTTEYRITVDGEQGPETPYGDVATVKVGGAIYYADVDDSQAQAVPVYRVETVTEVESNMEEVAFDGDEPEELEEVDVTEGPGLPDEEEDDEEQQEDEEGGEDEE